MESCSSLTRADLTTGRQDANNPCSVELSILVVPTKTAFTSAPQVRQPTFQLPQSFPLGLLITFQLVGRGAEDSSLVDSLQHTARRYYESLPY